MPAPLPPLALSFGSHSCLVGCDREEGAGGASRSRRALLSAGIQRFLLRDTALSCGGLMSSIWQVSMQALDVQGWGVGVC